MVWIFTGCVADPSGKVGTGQGDIFRRRRPKGRCNRCVKRNAADRLFAGIDLIEHQKAPLLILTRGQLPWSKGAAEGEVLADLAKKYGVDPKQIRLTPPVQNTDQEARAIAALMPQEQRRIVLVTSAFHMPRAQQVFAAQGLMIHPYPVDFRATYKQANFLDFLPTAEAFEETSLCVREMIGRLYYRLKYPD